MMVDSKSASMRRDKTISPAIAAVQANHGPGGLDVGGGTEKLSNEVADGRLHLISTSLLLCGSTMLLYSRVRGTAKQQQRQEAQTAQQVYTIFRFPIF